VHSKLPDVGTTIFTVMSRRAAELDAVNLGQGFPDYDIDPRLAELTARAMRAGHNQYAPMPGVPALQQRIGEQLQRRYGWQGEPGTGITVTLGATEALFSAILACVGPGDEAIIFDPAYDSYDPAIRLAGARCVHVPLQPPDFRYDWDRVRALVNDRTRLVIVNSPGNPSCAVLREGDLDELAAVLRGRDAVVISDEVYEHVLLPGTRHHGVLAHAELAPKSFAIFSFGKSLHATGVRVGYAVAPPALTTELRKVHQFNTFTIATPFQHAIAEYLAEKPAVFDGLAAFFAERRAVMLEALQGTGLRPLASQGTYFQLVDYSGCPRLAGLDDLQAAMRLVEEGGVASIPLSPFYREAPGVPLLRLCFAKRDATLLEAGRRLRAFAGVPA
jgi:methionine aminotransferase